MVDLGRAPEEELILDGAVEFLRAQFLIADIGIEVILDHFDLDGLLRHRRHMIKFG